MSMNVQDMAIYKKTLVLLFRLEQIVLYLALGYGTHAKALILICILINGLYIRNIR